ncbi:hypothetical protein [Abyssibacter profundi]|uniref:Uncharacterized protein n=1 Tax=Abyssibacter profundi TaxID=2182787 RepID=A0A363ULD0_9GAMM|nr:hypothetical protein [Abyssibacter profundi]PWN56228.1 hypothetical protein DEH80_08115 [Abyssibacter profundi]
MLPNIHHAFAEQAGSLDTDGMNSSFSLGIRAPAAPGEMFSWIRKHEPIHAIPHGSQTTACGLTDRMITQSDCWRVSCARCRAELGMQAWQPKKGDPEWGLFIRY